MYKLSKKAGIRILVGLCGVCCVAIIPNAKINASISRRPVIEEEQVVQPQPLNNALHAAALTHNIAQLTILLDNGADVNQLSAMGGTPLRYALENFGEDTCNPTVQFLLSRGADVHAGEGLQVLLDSLPDDHPARALILQAV